MRNILAFLRITAFVIIICVLMITCTSDDTCIFSEWIDKDAATCTTPGTQERKCSCGNSEIQNVGTPLAHDWILTCLANGSITKTCRLCSIADPDTDPSTLEHDYAANRTIITHATTKTTGVEGRECRRTGCNAYTDPITIAIIPPLVNLTEAAAYLAVRPGTIANPLPMAMNFTFDVSLLQGLFNTIAAAGKYIDLDLSICNMSGTEFIPDFLTETGKNKIVSLTLPDAAISTSAGSSFASAWLHFDNLREITGENITTVGTRDFQGRANLISIVFPNLTTINAYSFQNCTGLEEIELPISLAFIGEYAFANCGNLEVITIHATTPPTLANSNAFAQTSADLQIKVPAGSVELYREALNWNAYADKISAN